MRIPLILALVALLASPVRADPGAEARDLAQHLVEAAHGALTDPGLDQAARMAALKVAIGDAFAFDVWEKFLVGDEVVLSEAERAEFRGLLPGFIAQLYATQFGRGLEAKPRILDTRPARSDTLVRAEIARANGKLLPVDWRVRDFPDRGPRVIDVMVGGTSFLILKRDEFAAILDQGGATALLAHMRANAV